MVHIGMSVIVNGTAGRVRVFSGGEGGAGHRVQSGVLGFDGMALHRDAEGHDGHQHHRGNEPTLESKQRHERKAGRRIHEAAFVAW